MRAQTPTADPARGGHSLLAEVANWFIPAALLHSRTHRGLAQMFVMTHLLGAIGGVLLLAHLAPVMRAVDPSLWALLLLVAIFASLPFVLRQTGNMSLVTMTSFQVLVMLSLIGTYDFGGFASPFLPWLLVSLMSGLFYQSRRTGLVLGLFIADVAVFMGILVLREQPNLVPAGDLKVLGWVSIAVAMTYMALMAIYYARIISSRADLELEAERYRTASVELEQARAVAERVNRNRSLFFSKMSHELRTPLNAIIGYSEILLEDCEDAGSANPQRLADLGRINSTGKHLLSLVSDVLDADSFDGDRVSVEVRRFSLGELCDDVVATAQPLIEQGGNRLVVDCPLRQDEVATDDKKLRQMLLNLLSNAGKFTSGGTVTLELWIERGLADDRLHAAVRDTGIGIAPEVLPQLFETYMQADATIYGRFGGTGLGLALTRKFSVLLGGSISVASRLGEGACFTIDIPAELRLEAPQDDKGGNEGRAAGGVGGSTGTMAAA
jgi:signal transduction histidine kinase